MSPCDDILEAVLLGGELDPAAAAHVRECARCGQEAPALQAIAAALRGDVVPDPAAGLRQRTLATASPLLAGRTAASERSYRRHLGRAVAAALLPLPLVLVLDAYVVRGFHAVLSVLLPATVSTYLAFNFAALVMLATALTYAAVPVLADRQLRLARRLGS
jgi:hypothetical protein